MSASARRKAEMSRLRGENCFMRRELAKVGHYLAGDELVFVVSHVNNSITGAVFSKDGAHDHIMEVKLSADTVDTVVDPELLKEAEKAVGQDRLLDLKTGDISDFTQIKDPSKFRKVAKLLADIYKKLLALTKAEPNIKLVRLSGHLRNKLCRSGNEELKRKWIDAVQFALGGSMSGAWDYSLLEPEEEALFNHKSFFEMNSLCFQQLKPGGCLPTEVAALWFMPKGCQTFCSKFLDEGGDKATAINPNLGISESSSDRAAMATVESLKLQFMQELSPALKSGCTELVLLNAIKTLVKIIGTAVWKGVEAFKKNVVEGAPFTPTEVHVLVEQWAAVATSEQQHLVVFSRALAAAVQESKGLEHIYIAHSSFQVSWFNHLGAAPPVSYDIIVDQGGGSCSVYQFQIGQPGHMALFLKKQKSTKSIYSCPKLVEEMKRIPDLSGFDIINEKDKTFNDYSELHSSHFHFITDFLVGFYHSLIKHLMEGRRGKINKIIIRQTGKIRAKLLKPENSEMKTVWDDAMNQSIKKQLGALCDNINYQLMSNALEADLEAKAFFSLNRWDEIDRHCETTYDDLTKVVGIGVGSSSTQVYSRTTDDVVSSADATLGAKPTSTQIRNENAGKPKTATEFKNQFMALLKPHISSSHKERVVILNAIGYCFASMSDGDWEGVEEFKTNVIESKQIAVEDFLKYAEAFDKLKPSFVSGIILGLALALTETKTIKWVLCDRKRKLCPDGESLPVSTSWVHFVVKK